MGLFVLTLLLGLGLRQTLCDQVVGTYNQMLDPGRLYWWKTKWAPAPIDLSKTNAGSTAVSVSFYLNPSTSLTSGFLEVTFPAGFTLSNIVPSTTVSGQVVQIPATLVAGQDSVFTISLVSLPTTAGPTGLFALRTRLTPGGQVIDANLNFGSVYISAQEGKIASGAVTFTPTQSSSVINRAGNALTFKFTIGKNLWKHDLIRVTTDSNYALNLGSSQCLSVDTAGSINNFNGTSTTSPHTLNCVASAKTVGQSQTLWIYGLSVTIIDVSIKDNTFVTLQVPGFTNPDRVYASSTWTIETVRFGTKNTLESLQTAGPVLTAGTVTSGTWTSTWGMAASNLVNGLSVYMDLSFSLVNPVPLLGTVTVTTTELSVGTCTVLTSLGAGTVCTVSSSGVFVITGFDAIPTSTAVTLRHILTVNGAAAASASFKVASVDSASLAIDQSAALGAFTVSAATNLSKIATFKVKPQVKSGTETKPAGGIGDATQYLAFGMKTLSPVLTAANIDIFCPIASAVDDFQFSIPTTVSAPYNNLDNSIFDSPTNILGTTGAAAATGVAPTISAGSMATTMTPGKISFKPGSDLIGQSMFWVGLVATTGIITLPRVINNARTAYECRVEIAESSGATPQKWIGVDQFSIAWQPFSTFTASYFCSNTQLDGNPLKVTFSPQVLDIPASTATRTYYVEIGMPTDFPLRQGLSEGAAYPVDSSLSTGLVMTVGSTAPPNSASFGHQVTGLGLVPATLPTPISLYFPVKAVALIALSFSLQSYYTLVSDKQALKYITHYKTASYTLSTGTPATLGALNIGNNGPVNGSSMSAGLSLTSTLNVAITGDTYFYLVFPKGYVFNNLRDVQSSFPSASTSFTEKKYFSSPNPSFPFPGVLVKATTSGAQIATASVISVLGLVVPLGQDPGSTLTLVHSAVTGNLNTDCFMQVSNAGFTTSAGTITSWTVSPGTIKARGPGGVDITHIITVSLPHGIDNGGKINFDVDSAWQPGPGFYCQVIGINNAQCKMTTSSVVIDGFDDFSKQTNVSVQIYLVHLLPPALTTNISTNFQLVTISGFTTTTSVTLGSRIIDTSASGGANGIVLVQPFTLPGVATFEAIRVIPPNAGTQNNDLYVRFYMQYDLPTNSVITLASGYTPLTGSDLRAKCWLSPLAYSNCAVSGSEFTVTLSQSYTALSLLELFIRTAVTAPTDVSTTSSTTVYSFKVKATWGSTVLIDYPTTLSPSQIITPAPKVAAQITAGTVPISYAPTNAGESASYTFSFTLNVSPTAADSIWLVWPDDYDPYIGKATETLSQEPGNFYLPCASVQLGASLNCRIDHWTMVLSGFTAGTAPLAVSLQVDQVINPAAAVVTGSFRLLHFDGNSTLVEYLNALGTVKPTALPAGLIDVRTVASTAQDLFSSGDYTFELYVADTLSTTSLLQVLFPPQYALNLQDKKDSYTCNTTFVDETTTTRLPQTWNNAPSCSISQNTISLPAPTLSKDLTKGQLLSLVVNSVTTPQYGLMRTATSPLWDFDVQDRSVYMLSSWWTSKFEFFIYNSASAGLQYTSKSHFNLNSAYLGFMQPQRPIFVNNYSPADNSNRILVWPGTQTDLLTISTVNSTFPMSANKLVLAPTVNSKTPDGGRIKFTSVKDNFVMLFGDQTIHFRVSADIAIPKGLYYISWQSTETYQNGTIVPLYSPPPMTLIEIPSLVRGKYTFTVSSVPSVPVGGSSLPIKVAISNPPHSDVVINLAFLLTPAAQAVPSSLTFTSDVTEQYFSITLNSTHDVSLFPSFQVLFNLTGTDAPAYSVQPAMTVGVVGQADPSQGLIVKLGVSSIKRTTVSLAPVTDRSGVLYYVVEPKGKALLSFEQVKALATTFDSSLNVTSDGTRNDEETGPALGETWRVYQTNKLTKHARTFQSIGAIPMAATSITTPVVVTGLVPSMDYQVIGYLDLLDGNVQPGSRLEYFKTSAMPQCAMFSLTFQLSVAAVQMNNIINSLAPLLNANPLQIAAGYMNQTTARLLQSNNTTTPPPTAPPAVTSTTFTFTLLSNILVELPIPITQVALSPQALEDLKVSLASKGITNTMTAYSQLGSPTPIVPVWDKAVEVVSYTNVSATLAFRANTPGLACCVALEEASPSLLPEQVMLAYSANWTQVIQACTFTNLTLPSNQVTIEALQPDTNYYLSCMATDDLPIFPTAMQHSETFPVPFIPIHTPIDMETDLVMTSAVSLVLGAAAFALL